MQPYPKSAIKYFLRSIHKYRKVLFFVLPSIFVASIFERLAPYFFSKMIDVFSAALNEKTLALEGIYPYFWGFVVSLVLYNIIRQTGMFIILNIISKLVVRVKAEAFAYMNAHSMQYLTNQQSGKLGAKVNELANETKNMFHNLLWGFYYPFVVMTVTFIMLFLTNWLFGALFLFWLIVFGGILYFSSAFLKKYSSFATEQRSITAGRIIDTLSNCGLVKSFSSFKYESQELDKLLKNERNALKTMFLKTEISRFCQFIVVALFQISMLGLAVWLWYKGIIETGAIVFVLMLISSVMGIFQHFVFALLDWNHSVGAIENCLEHLSVPHGIVDKKNAKTLKVKNGKIEFKNISFKYPNRKNIFQDFNLTINAGEKVGLVGVSGSGKSSLVSLLQRFYELQQGDISIDGQNIADVTQDSLHQNIAVIPQDTSLFHRTIYENIAYGNPKASKKQVLEASKKAYADDFISEMPNAYESMVGDRGIKVSGGQRQRIAVARAILKNAPILILDEATSALDSESEQFIQKSMKSLMWGKTVIAIAHRLSTLKEMDRIIVMSKGKIIEQGKPEELLKRKGTYARLWQIQTGKEK